jgi:hypothetical protein
MSVTLGDDVEWDEKVLLSTTGSQNFGGALARLNELLTSMFAY